MSVRSTICSALCRRDTLTLADWSFMRLSLPVLTRSEKIGAVASHKDLAGVILVQGRQPEKDTIAQAEKENIPILVTDLPAFEVVGRLYKAGIRGA